jgi:hypothetical protein
VEETVAFNNIKTGGSRDRMVDGFITTYAITTNVMSSNPAQNQSEIRIDWRSCLLTDRNEMSNLGRGLSIDTSYQVFVELAKRFQKRKVLYNICSINSNKTNHPDITEICCSGFQQYKNWGQS